MSYRIQKDNNYNDTNAFLIDRKNELPPPSEDESFNEPLNLHERIHVGDLAFHYGNPREIPIIKASILAQDLLLFWQNPTAAKCHHVGIVTQKSEDTVEISHSFGPNGGPCIYRHDKNSSALDENIFMSAILPNQLPKEINIHEFEKLVGDVGQQFSKKHPDCPSEKSSYARILRQGAQPHLFTRYSKYDVSESVVDYLLGNPRIDHFENGKPVGKPFGCSEFAYTIIQTAFFISVMNEVLKGDILSYPVNSEEERQKLIDRVYSSFNEIFQYDLEKSPFYTQHSLSLIPGHIFNQLEKNGADWISIKHPRDNDCA